VFFWIQPRVRCKRGPSSSSLGGRVVLRTSLVNLSEYLSRRCLARALLPAPALVTAISNILGEGCAALFALIRVIAAFLNL
jgi:hypothetical protein